MHELAVIAHKIDEMKVNIAWITECFCSGVIVVNELNVDNKLDDFNHELLEFLRTRIFRMTRILSLRLFSLSFIYIRLIRLIRVRFNPYLVFFQITSYSWSPSATPVGRRWSE